MSRAVVPLPVGAGRASRAVVPLLRGAGPVSRAAALFPAARGPVGRAAVALLLLTGATLAFAPGAEAAKRQPVCRPAAKAPKAPSVLPAAAKRRHGARSRRRGCARSRGGHLLGTSGLGRASLPGVPAAPPGSLPPTFTAQPSPQAAPVDAPAPAPLPPVYSNPRAVQVQAFEFGLQLSKATVLAGDVRVEFNSSRAEDPHDLVAAREDGTGPVHRFGEQPSGAVTTRTLALSAGGWILFCSLPGHRAAGMRVALRVD